MPDVLELFPGGRHRALCLSYDDGRQSDRRLVEVLNRNQIKATFHLNSGKLGEEGYLARDEMRSLFVGHEVASHTVTHPILTRLSPENIAREVVGDRRTLEELVGYPVRGFSYPAGVYDSRTFDLLPALGIAYARTTRNHGGLHLPADLFSWGATCHHNEDLLQRASDFKALKPGREPYLLFVWGHSFEFDRDGRWGMLEEFCSTVRGDPDIWYATCIEVADYIGALRRLVRSADNRMFHNPSAVPVYLWAESRLLEVIPGESVRI